MTDLSSILLDPIYGDPFISVAAMLTSNSSAGIAPLRAIDKTAGATVNETARGAGYGLQTIRPGATVRARELTDNSLTPSDLDGGSIELNTGTPDAKTWKIDSHQLMPGPQGELSGEILLILRQP